MLVAGKRSILLVLLCLTLLAAGCGGAQGNNNSRPTPTQQPPSPVLPTLTPPVVKLPSLRELYNALPHLHMFELRAATVFNRSGKSPLLYHHDVVMHTSTTYAIFWEPPRLPDGSATHISPTYHRLIERYFKDIGRSSLYDNNTQYYDLSGSIENSSLFGGAWVDRSAYPASRCFSPYTPHGCLVDAQIQSEVTKAMKVNKWTAGPTHLFFVFTSWGEGSCADSLSNYCAFSTYCAYHSFYNLAGRQVLYANMAYMSTVPRACDVPTSPNNDLDADSTIDVTSHEQMEAVTDPLISAWYDNSYNEIGDKCAWNFGKPSFDGGKANVVWNGHYYMVQQEWSDLLLGCTLKG